MYWTQSIQNALRYIEDALLDELTIDGIAGRANSSSEHFQRVFSIVTGMPIKEYIRVRRLSLAGRELAETDVKVVDVALKYGYETAESFTKAFTRFHGISPSAAKRRADGLKYFSPITIRIDISGGYDMRRRLIPDVPVIAYDGNNAAFFITLLEATLRAMGEECDRARLIALSGEGNRFCWTEGAWAFGNEVIESINETPFETEHRVLSAIGWRARYVTVQFDARGEFLNTDRMQIRRDFVDSIDRGFPVLIRYIEHDDCDLNLFFGYEDDGERIVGYDYNRGFEVGRSMTLERDAPTPWAQWERNLSGYILLKSKGEQVPERAVALSAFRQIVAHARSTKIIRGRRIGLCAWEAFLNQLEHDDFTALSLEEVGKRFIIYCDALCQIHARSGALPYYERLAEQFPEWKSELGQAIEALTACAGYGGFLWSRGFTFDDAGYEKFRSPEARRVLADEGRRAMRQDRRAIEQFEEILHLE